VNGRDVFWLHFLFIDFISAQQNGNISILLEVTSMVTIIFISENCSLKLSVSQAERTGQKLFCRIEFFQRIDVVQFQSSDTKKELKFRFLVKS
jgi:hypothetical protein